MSTFFGDKNNSPKKNSNNKNEYTKNIIGLFKGLTQSAIEKVEDNQPQKIENKPEKKSGGTGFFAKSQVIDFKNEPLGSYYEERKKIIFGKIDLSKRENEIY